METKYPELKTRLQSTVIDFLLMFGLMCLAAMIFDKINPSQDGEDGWIRGIIFISIWGVYEPVAITMGSTLGNFLMKIKVRDNLNTAKRINLLQSYIRFVLKFLLGWVSFLTIHGNKQRRAIHDFAAGSVMIEK
ncbi:MAG: RDD family protein [Chitinophagaceae bacterium]|nr:RDD family protein [Chitinophagaceae bacterium]